MGIGKVVVDDTRNTGSAFSRTMEWLLSRSSDFLFFEAAIGASMVIGYVLICEDMTEVFPRCYSLI